MKRKLFIFFTLLFATVQYILAESDKVALYDAREILIISSYNPESPYIYNNIFSFQSSYKNLGGQYKIALEELRCNGLGEANEWVPRLDATIQKHVSVQAIILIGAEANVAFASSKVKSYKNIPIYSIMTPLNVASMPEESGLSKAVLPKGKDSRFCSVPQMLKGYNVRYASFYKYDIDKEMELIHKIFPRRKTFVAICDNSFSGLGHLRLIKDYFKRNPEYKFHIIDGRKMSMQKAIEIYEEFDPNETIGLLGNWRMSKDNSLYISNAVYAFTQANRRIPVFSHTGTGIGYWAVGGCVPSYRNVGEELASQVYKEIDENKIVKPNIFTFPTHYQFDQLMLNEYDIPQELLPENSEIINRAFTINDFLEQYRWTVIMVCIIIILIICICIGSIIYSIHSRHLKKMLEESQEKLESEKDELTRSKKELELAVCIAKEANKTKDDFVANISHEVRTPLNAITGFADIISEQTKDEECKEYAAIIRSNTDMLLKLINDVLDISNIESQNITLELTSYDLVPYFDSIVSVYKGKKEHVDLHFTCSEKELTFTTDISQIQQVLLNLIGNAIKFTKEGSIDVFLTRAENGIKFSVSDTGIGIPEAKSEEVFERFVKLDSFKQGTGLGLSLCRMIIENLGGTINVDTTYNQGARINVYLPTKKNE